MKSSPEQLERVGDLDPRDYELTNNVRRGLPILGMAVFAFGMFRLVKKVQKERAVRQRRALVADRLERHV